MQQMQKLKKWELKNSDVRNMWGEVIIMHEHQKHDHPW